MKMLRNLPKTRVTYYLVKTSSLIINIWQSYPMYHDLVNSESFLECIDDLQRLVNISSAVLKSQQ